MNKKGQAATELVLILPLFLILAAGMLGVGYMCWQGLKTQQAANLAARIQGQQRVGGGLSVDAIDLENGQGGYTEANLPVISNEPETWGAQPEPNSRSVYQDLYKSVKGLFSVEEAKRLYVLRPDRGVNTDKVTIVRMMDPSKLNIFGLKMKPIQIKATAYGGEDSRMYGSPRWGRTGPNQSSFYQSQIKKGTED